MMDQMGICLINDNFMNKHGVTPFRFFLGIKNGCFFLCYYLICWLSIMDLAKLQVLKNNHRLAANLYLTMLAG